MDILNIIKRVFINNRINEELLYEIVYDELSNNSMSKGLWLKAVTETAGDTERAKYVYVRYRVQAITDEIAIYNINAKDNEAKVANGVQQVLKNVINFKWHHLDNALNGDQQACYSIYLWLRSECEFINAYFWVYFSGRSKDREDLKKYMSSDQIDTSEYYIKSICSIGGLTELKRYM